MIVEHIETGSLVFCPGSQISDKPLKDISDLMNVEQEFAIIKLDKTRGNAMFQEDRLLVLTKKLIKQK